MSKRTGCNDLEALYAQRQICPAFPQCPERLTGGFCRIGDYPFTTCKLECIGSGECTVYSEFLNKVKEKK